MTDRKDRPKLDAAKANVTGFMDYGIRSRE